MLKCPKYFLIGLCCLLVAAAALLSFLLYIAEKPEEHPKLRYEVYSQLDKLCKDVNALEKIQIAIYFIMQSWLTACDSTPDTIDFAPLKFMKKKIHSVVTQKIQDFDAKDEQSVEDCIITYFKTEINSTNDDFHQMLFEMVLQGYMKTFNESIKLDDTEKFLKMELMNCTGTDTCQYNFTKPPSEPQMIEVIVNKTKDDPEDVREKICVQIFQHLYIWNEKIKKPEMFEWSYFMLFKGLVKALNTTELDVKKNLLCASSQMQAMEKAITAEPYDVNPFLILFLRERDSEIEVLEDQIDYETNKQISKVLKRQLEVQELIAELVIKAYMEMFDISPEERTIAVGEEGGGPSIVIEVPPMKNIPLL